MLLLSCFSTPLTHNLTSLHDNMNTKFSTKKPPRSVTSIQGRMEQFWRDVTEWFLSWARVMHNMYTVTSWTVQLLMKRCSTLYPPLTTHTAVCYCTIPCPSPWSMVVCSSYPSPHPPHPHSPLTSDCWLHFNRHSDSIMPWHTHA